MFLNIPEDFRFLTSTRFWAIVIGGLAIYLESRGLIGEAERNLIATIATGFTVVRSADRFSEQISNK
jgi:hypothetical protein